MKRTQKRFVFLLILSFIVHLFVFLVMWFLKSDKNEKTESTSITIQIKAQTEVLKNEHEEVAQPKIIEPEPEPEPEHVLPVDNADQFSSNNQQDRALNKIIFGQASAEKEGELKKRQESSSNLKDKKASVMQQDEIAQLDEQAQSRNAKQNVDKVVETDFISSKLSNGITREKKLTETSQKELSQGQAVEQAALPKPSYNDYFSGALSQEGEEEAQASDYVDELVFVPGNVALLADNEMSEVVVKQPFSELKSKELKLANEFLDRMNKQVLSVWQNPYKGKHVYRGIIKLELDEDGYLEDVYIFRASGHPVLDASVIKAIKAVGRFKVPENKIITNKYYRNLRFHYSSIESKTELMPFEQEAKQKE